MIVLRDFVKENLMMLIFGGLLFGIIFLGSLANVRMDYSSVENEYMESVRESQI